ncbi:MAG: hypothetical protein ACTSR3_21630 [Candidatus Helarchaeota archaeon]
MSIFNIPLLLGIIGIYFTYFTILEELIVRYKLRDYQLILWAFFLGIFVIAFTGGQIFNPRPALEMFFIFGINYIDFIFVNVIWWSLFQTVLAFYFANRVTRRDWEHERLGKIGWFLTIFIFCLILFLFQLGRFLIYRSYGYILDFLQITRYIVFGTLEGYISMTIFVCIFGYLSLKELKKNEESRELIAEFEQARFIDVILVLIIIISFISVFFVGFIPTWSGTSYINRYGTAIIIASSVFFGILIIIYRIVSKKSISV